MLLSSLLGLWAFRRIFHMSIGTRDFVKVVLMFYIALFIVSIPWNWMALYQQVNADMQIDFKHYIYDAYMMLKFLHFCAR